MDYKKNINIGVIIYKINNDNKIEMLLINKNGLYRDLVNNNLDYNDDEYIFDNIISLIQNESNHKINIIKDRFSMADNIFSSNKKCIFYFLKATREEELLKSQDFGNINLFNSKRKIEWLDINQLLKSYKINIKKLINLRFHIKLRDNEFLNKIYLLNNKIKYIYIKKII